jgi:hypothetical protein
MKVLVRDSYHGTENEDQDDRGARDEDRVDEIGRHRGLAEHLGEVLHLREIGQCEGVLEDLARRLEGGEHHHHDRIEHDEGVRDQDDLSEQDEGNRLARCWRIVGDSGQNWISRRRSHRVSMDAKTTMKRKRSVARAEPMPKFWMLALWLPKAVR